MALLIINLDKIIGTAAAWRDTFAQQLPDLEIRIWPEAGDPSDIRISRLHASGTSTVFAGIPEAEGHVQPLGRASRSSPVTRSCRGPGSARLSRAGGDPMMTEYVVMHVLQLHRDMPAYRAAQANREWRRVRIVPAARGTAHRLSWLRADGEGAGAGAEIARLPHQPVAKKADAPFLGPDDPYPAPFPVGLGP